jgi:hypothetical protein
MTDRVRTLTVILEAEFRVDSLQPLAEAISMLVGVREVRLGEVTDANEYAYGMQLKDELRRKLYEVLK